MYLLKECRRADILQAVLGHDVSCPYGGGDWRTHTLRKVRGCETLGLEQVPEELVVDLVVILDLRGLDEGAQGARAAIR